MALERLHNTDMASLLFTCLVEQNVSHTTADALYIIQIGFRDGTALGDGEDVEDGSGWCVFSHAVFEKVLVVGVDW